MTPHRRGHKACRRSTSGAGTRQPDGGGRGVPWPTCAAPLPAGRRLPASAASTPATAASSDLAPRIRPASTSRPHRHRASQSRVSPRTGQHLRPPDADEDLLAESQPRLVIPQDPVSAAGPRPCSDSCCPPAHGPLGRPSIRPCSIRGSVESAGCGCRDGHLMTPPSAFQAATDETPCHRPDGRHPGSRGGRLDVLAGVAPAGSRDQHTASGNPWFCPRLSCR
jgi:hypothetical protein